MGLLYNLARMTTAATGAGSPITLGAAVSGYLTFAQAGVTDGQRISYAIADGANSEIGEGIYTTAGTTLTRVVTASTNANAAISLSGNAQVFISPRAEDLLPVVVLNRQSINADYTLPTNLNGSSVGPITVAGGAIVTVPTGSRWLVN
jgi:hypothetical protein